MRRAAGLRITRTLFALAVACASVAALAADHNRFKWRDAAGNLHYADVLPAEAARLGYEVVNPQGLVIRRVERARTAEEIAAAKVIKAREDAAKRALEEQARANEQLLAGYPNEKDLQRAQQQKLDLLGQQVIAAEINLRGQEQALADALSRAADAERTGVPLTPKASQQLADLRREVDNLRMLVVRRQNERDASSHDFDRELARYRELKRKAAEP